MTLNGITRTDGINSLTDANASMQSAKLTSDSNNFMSLVNQMKNQKESNNIPSVSSTSINSSGKLNGDYTQGFRGLYTSESDKHAKPQGAAANSGSANQKTIDKTSKLYEQALELENYFVKEMLSSMRKTVSKTNLLSGENDYAQSTYEDMLYDNYAESLTKNGHFGLADQIYLQLDTKA